jgi:dehydrogenase/reductase SDR family member 7B
MKFKDKVIWITGASSGIGEAMVKAFHMEGAHIILSARNLEALHRIQIELTNKTIPSAILPLDLRKYRDFDALSEEAISLFGKVDILINNGGISQRSLAKETLFADELKILETDLIGTIALTKSILPHLIERKGQIVVISSVMGKINTKYRTSYAAAKHGLVGYFESLHLELAEDGVNVCNIMPGFIATNITKNAVGSTEQISQSSQNNLGMSTSEFAQKAVEAIYLRKHRVYIGGIKEQIAMLLKRISPNLFDRFIINQKVT